MGGDSGQHRWEQSPPHLGGLGNGQRIVTSPRPPETPGLTRLLAPFGVPFGLFTEPPLYIQSTGQKPGRLVYKCTWRKENLGLDGCTDHNPLLKENDMGITKILASIEANRDLIAFNLGLEEDAG